MSHEGGSPQCDEAEIVAASSRRSTEATLVSKIKAYMLGHIVERDSEKACAAVDELSK